MDKTKLKNDVGMVATVSAYMGKHMKVDDLEKIITDEERMLLGAYARLALAVGELSEAIDALPD